ncbi:SH3 domain-containing protein [Vermiculatibacterium agrestimuris]|uniref:SH3 domain-containing protein n=1 Tax=Vermiculatibacterium agrestimuris TaxID=2941519 RepID=UPI00203C5C65|nr:SH3 domain-containing protein [Vermiculatibacterium agrestimuris]
MATKTTAAAAKKDKDEANVLCHVVDAPNGLSLREGPHLDFKRLDVLTNGAEVGLLPLPGGVKVPKWSLVTTHDHTGWVMDRFLREG